MLHWHSKLLNEGQQLSWRLNLGDYSRKEGGTFWLGSTAAHRLFFLQEMSKSGASALGIDWTCSARNARYLSGGQITLQGNYDPSRLLSPIPEIKKQVKLMINAFGKDRYIVNLGHGILPNIPVDHAKAFVDAVKEYQS